MRVITAESVRTRKQMLMSRRVLVSTGALAGAGAMLARPGSLFAQNATPTIEGTPLSGDLLRNPWEPEWSAEPPFFEVVRHDGDTVTVNSFYDGLQEFSVNAERIFLMSGEEDIFLALGLDDRIAGVVADANDVLYYTNMAVAAEHLDLGALTLSENIYEPDLEVILSADPDLILGQGQWILTDAIYPVLAAAVPTLRYPNVSFLYPRQAVHDFGRLFDVADQADAALASYNDTMQRGREAIAPVVGDLESVVTWYQGDGVFIVYPQWTRNPDTGGIEASSSVSNPVFLELGMKPLAAVEALADADRSQYYLEMSAEQFGALDPDYLFIAGSPEQIEAEMLSLPVVQAMRAVQEGNVVGIDDTGSLGLGYFGNLAQVGLIVESLTGEPFE